TTFHSFARWFLPWLGVSELEKAMVNISAGFRMALNATGESLTAQQTEIESLRKASAQYKLTLDILFAKEGGLFAMLNDSCCFCVDQSKRSEMDTH
ncbi:EFC1 protein, partial [Tricholaema leucomelas]|nr:EFC1 protein [Tricholaema leucomelas]